MASTGAGSVVGGLARASRGVSRGIPMAYDHGTKAGNRGDVWKHAVLVSVADRLTPATTLRYMESHSGAPIHAPARTGEWKGGILAALDRGPVTAHPYLALAEEYVARSELAWRCRRAKRRRLRLAPGQGRAGAAPDRGDCGCAAERPACRWVSRTAPRCAPM